MTEVLNNEILLSYLFVEVIKDSKERFEGLYSPTVENYSSSTQKCYIEKRSQFEYNLGAAVRQANIFSR